MDVFAFWPSGQCSSQVILGFVTHQPAKITDLLVKNTIRDVTYSRLAGYRHLKDERLSHEVKTLVERSVFNQQGESKSSARLSQVEPTAPRCLFCHVSAAVDAGLQLQSVKGYKNIL